MELEGRPVSERFSPHALRRACATHNYERGVDLVAIQQMLGHWTVSSTMRDVRPSATFIEDAYQRAVAGTLAELRPDRDRHHPRRAACGSAPVTLGQQRQLFRRWTTDDQVHPHEALLGMLALLHGASSTEVRTLKITDIDTAAQAVRLGKRRHPVPLDPASWTGPNAA
ncbi:site-specific integrase [Streptomyces sp. HNM0663]|uniref:Site-specific integrase n=1 Tax=Streptomyces chengmaiensis TaxID=3040919 RepID=A0ABT6HGT0_9ACTN|nr:site-specific integrase [Streptomyces chengmaiensis]MDH2387971.1 site-specific integrase [Streptomyces chengmaiensis]